MTDTLKRGCLGQHGCNTPTSCALYGCKDKPNTEAETESSAKLAERPEDNAPAASMSPPAVPTDEWLNLARARMVAHEAYTAERSSVIDGLRRILERQYEQGYDSTCDTIEETIVELERLRATVESLKMESSHLREMNQRMVEVICASNPLIPQAAPSERIMADQSRHDFGKPNAWIPDAAPQGDSVANGTSARRDETAVSAPPAVAADYTAEQMTSVMRSKRD